MAAAQRAGLHVGDSELDDLVAQQRDDPADGTNERELALAGPVHGLRPGQLGDDGRQRVGEQLARVATGHRAMQRVVFALGRGLHCEGFHGDVVAPRKALSRTWPRLLRRSHDDLFAVFLPFGQFGAQHQPARRTIQTDRACLEAVLVEELLEQPVEIGQRRLDHPMRNLFDAQLEQERKCVAHCATSTGAALSKACCSIHAVATPTASLRTRPMTPTRSVTLIAPRASSRLNVCEQFSTWS